MLNAPTEITYVTIIVTSMTSVLKQSMISDRIAREYLTQDPGVQSQ